MQDGEECPLLNGVSQWLKVAGVRHATVPLVLLHGGPGGNHFVFERTAGRGLEARRTVVYWEQRGCGRSDAPRSPDAYSVSTLMQDLNALMAHLGVIRMDLLGYSFGGGLALEYSRAHPDHVRRVIAQAPVLHLRAPEVVQTQLAGFREVVRGEMTALLDNILSENVSDEDKLKCVWNSVDTDTIDRFLFQNPRAAALNRHLWSQSGLVNTGDMHRALLSHPFGETPQRLSDIRVPVLVLVGAHDRNVGPAVCRRVAAGMPQAQLHVFEHSAHFPDIEETGAWTQEVLDFLA